ncbi:hypothetical protein PFICI_04174 [Pestalotiopsis fici W106-1]|uniref:Uncharacterized protein n=1 Tax=Pestalotiopsis fici (strain W106-1 / CGMCC3.15140) TaxID=1229662 RepID=W3XJF0_PESFW|nr:uncharacterized protein PFICI_04174 [Pestalotiopsis fici W106-1]ETS86149.1 hypothetical protein PFICI_04174 [Pestalotiopsis fici W106-1]
MKAVYLYASVLCGISATVAQSTTSSASEGTGATDSDTSTSLSLETAYAGSSTFTATAVTEITSTITSTDANGDTSLIITSYATTSTETISGTSSTTFSSVVASSSIDTDSVTTISSTTSSASTFSTTSTTSSITTATTSPTTPTTTTLPISTDASSYLSYAFPTGAPQPTWATGEYYTMLASAIYSVDRSFIQQSDYQSIISAIQSAADKAGNQVSASVESSAWGWGAITTNAWYQDQVPAALQTEVLDYNSAWHSAVSSIQALATATTPNRTVAAAPAPRCTGIAMAGIAAGMAGIFVAM